MTKQKYYRLDKGKVVRKLGIWPIVAMSNSTNMF